MKEHIFINSNLILNLIFYLLNLSEKKKEKNICPVCKEKFNYIYVLKIKNQSIKIFDFQTHLFTVHNLINNNFYKKIITYFYDGVSEKNSNNNNVIFNINWILLDINKINILDGLYEVGSNKIYAEKNKNLSESKISRFSEHSGFIYFENNTISNIIVSTKSRVDKSDPLIFMPGNCLEALKVNYIYHTHPKTPYIGSRIKHGIIYEFPSISDIIHFVEHHNNGKLLGSIILAPEGIYIIRKNNFDRNMIHIDYDIMIKDLEEIFDECYNDSYSQYSKINYNNFKINGVIKIPDKFFYEEVSINYEYINRINKVLEKYDIFIDYYSRILFNDLCINDSCINDNNKWIFDNIYIPLIN